MSIRESLQQVRAEYEAMTMEELLTAIDNMGPVVVFRIAERGASIKGAIDELMAIEEELAFG